MLFLFYLLHFIVTSIYFHYEITWNYLQWVQHYNGGPSATYPLTVYYVDYREDTRFCFISKLMFYRVDNKQIITLA